MFEMPGQKPAPKSNYEIFNSLKPPSLKYLRLVGKKIRTS